MPLLLANPTLAEYFRHLMRLDRTHGFVTHHSFTFMCKYTAGACSFAHTKCVCQAMCPRSICVRTEKSPLRGGWEDPKQATLLCSYIPARRQYLRYKTHHQTLFFTSSASTVVARWPCIRLVGSSSPCLGLWCLSCLLGRNYCGWAPQWGVELAPADVLESIFIDGYQNWNSCTSTLMAQIVAVRQGTVFCINYSTEASSLGMLGECFGGSWSPSMSIYLISFFLNPGKQIAECIEVSNTNFTFYMQNKPETTIFYDLHHGKWVD